MDLFLGLFIEAFITEADIDVAYRSDHSPVYIELNFSEHRRGKGTWKFNNSLLYDKEYINIVKECIKDVINQSRYFLNHFPFCPFLFS
jgi:hypothetical protein